MQILGARIVFVSFILLKPNFRSRTDDFGYKGVHTRSYVYFMRNVNAPALAKCRGKLLNGATGGRVGGVASRACSAPPRPAPNDRNALPPEVGGFKTSTL
jgi:hypothetical protein